MPDPLADARRLLSRHFGYADFRPAQLPVVQSVLQGYDTLAILPTGGGKSICFQVPALVLGGLNVVVSPLISLMQDQVDAAQSRGIAAACLNSSLTQVEQGQVRASIGAGTLRLLYVSPERLERLSAELSAARVRPRLLVVDEAHCIAEWGQDFRPSYRKLARMRYRLGMPQVVALTGSATPGVRDQIIRTLRFRAPRAVHLGSFDRANLWFGAVRVESEAERLQALLQLLRGNDIMAIVYTPTRGTTESVTRALCEAGHRAAPYHAGLSRARRRAALEDFLNDRVDVIVATCAFGMGIDKPNVRMVVHWAPPATPEAYYQEAGRAGRDGEFARCVLLWRPTDAALHRRQLDVTFPPPRLLERIWRKPDGRVGVPNNVLDSAERLRRELRPERGPVDWRPVIQRRHEAELRIGAVEAYARGSGCRRQRLVGYFGEQLRRCAGCDRCGKTWQPTREAPEISQRFRRLRQALSRSKTPWGGCPLEPDVLRRLAACPPADAAALADVPGVGPELAARMAGAILPALGIQVVTGKSPGDDIADISLLVTLQNWRAEVARQAGVPSYLVFTDATLQRIAVARPKDRQELARIHGLGPRALEKFGAELLRIAGGQPLAAEVSSV